MLRIGLAPCGEYHDFPGMPSWMARLLSLRGIKTEEEARRFLHPSRDQLLSPLLLNDLEKAAALIRRMKENGGSAVIYGDYDVDGVCASAILWEALGQLGVKRQVYLPDRHAEGYGLNVPAVEALAREHRLLITVDCGIVSLEEVKRAKALGMDVIVTDHHRQGDELPGADAVVSPLLGDYPFPFLCGAGVAWKLASVLVGEKAEPLMELAALATVADMVPLTGENRVIAALGLEKLSRTSRPGLKAVMRRAGIQGKVNSDQVAFQIAPRMNACGRMDSARIALDMLLTRDENEAEEAALKMETLNSRRRSEENRVLAEAMDQVAAMDLVDKKAIVVSGEGWNSGVVGLAAGRIAEKYVYPTVALAREGDLCVGSARSAGDIDIHAALSRCADLFLRFGGHRQAAGLTLEKKNVPEFIERLSRAVEEQTGGRLPDGKLLCDGEMTLAEVTEETVRRLSLLEPFGMGNPAPRFLCERVEPMSFRAVGAEGKHLKCAFRQGTAMRDGIFFGGGDWAGDMRGLFSAAMSPVLNEFRGRISAECRLYALQLTPESLEEDKDREALSLFSENRGGEKAESAGMEALDSLMAGDQGTLLVCRTLKTALAMRKKYPEADFCLGKARDPRARNAILLEGSARDACAYFRAVVLCDGDTGESAAWRRACPRSRVLALPETEDMRALLRDAFVFLDALRGVYVTLKRQEIGSLEEMCGSCGLRLAQGAFALGVLEELALLEWSVSPFRAALLPMSRVSPEESGLYRLARMAKEG